MLFLGVIRYLSLCVHAPQEVNTCSVIQRTWVRKECLKLWHQLLLIMQQQGRGMANLSVLLWQQKSLWKVSLHHAVRCTSGSACSLSSIQVSNIYTKVGKINTAPQVSWSSPCRSQQQLNDLKNVSKWKQLAFRKRLMAKSTHSHYVNHAREKGEKLSPCSNSTKITFFNTW